MLKPITAPAPSVKVEPVTEAEASKASSSTRVPIAGLVGSAGNLDELRQLTAAKFAKLGVVLDDEGKAVRGLAQDSALKRPAAAIAEDGSDDTEDASSVEGIALTRPALSMMKTPPSSSDSTDKSAVGMPPGWTKAILGPIAGGRYYPMWTFPKGKKFKSWASAQRSIRTKK